MFRSAHTRLKVFASKSIQLFFGGIFFFFVRHWSLRLRLAVLLLQSISPPPWPRRRPQSQRFVEISKGRALHLRETEELWLQSSSLRSGRMKSTQHGSCLPWWARLCQPTNTPSSLFNSKKLPLTHLWLLFLHFHPYSPIFLALTLDYTVISTLIFRISLVFSKNDCRRLNHRSFY